MVFTCPKALTDSSSLASPRLLRADGFIDKLKAFAKEKSVPLTIETVKVLGEAMIKHILQ